MVLTLLVRGPRLVRRPRDLSAALGEATRTSAMLALILLGALFFAKAVALFGLAQSLADSLLALSPSPFVLFVLLLAGHVLAGMWLDGLSLILISVPVTLPLARAAGFDPLWYGIFLVITVEMAQITPPVGFNLFIVRDLADSSLAETARAALPFFSLLALVALLLYVLPVLALWPA
ncbi:MAG: TRAP transporter large permease subunit [Alphaproteobacteria bacterium]|nr:MAG: TRAP transporter large permease subunit [Alphaproteobacteria bacterium]